MKSQEILLCLYTSVSKQIGLYSERDVRTLVKRYAHEGEQFLSTALPSLDDALLQGLTEGVLPRITGWKTKRLTSLPEFLYGFWKRIFSDDGSLLHYPDYPTLRSMRIILRTFKKVFKVCAATYVNKAVDQFIDIDVSLGYLAYSDVDGDNLSQITQYLFGSTIGEALTNPGPWKHGPGSVSEGYDTRERYAFPVISHRIAEQVGADTFRATWYDLSSRPPMLGDIPARLVSVPKTATKPRLISIEPSYNQYIQQGYMASLYDGLCRYPVTNIRDQYRNRELARSGSITGDLSTIDLSEASDRLSLRLVRDAFSFNRNFLTMLENTRSPIIETSRGIHLLRKYASMGSALTFPIQTMVFFSILAYAICTVESKYSRSFVRSLLRRNDLGVYGDDIICPTKYTPTLIDLLHKFGLKVNTSKSFSKGFFRESCGGDYYMGVNVTPIYLRSDPPRSKHDVSAIESLSSYRNQLAEHFGTDLPIIERIDNYLISLLGSYPTVDNPQGIEGIVRSGPRDGRFRWNSQLMRLEVYAAVPVRYRRLNSGTHVERLFHNLDTNVLEDSQAYTHHGRPVSAKLKHRWIAVH